MSKEKPPDKWVFSCKKVRAPLFKLDINAKYFLTIFYKSKEYLDLAGESSEKTVEKTVGKTGKKIIELIKNDPKITVRELVKVTGMTRRGIEWNIVELKKKGILERIGPDKGGYWKVNSF